MIDRTTPTYQPPEIHTGAFQFLPHLIPVVLAMLSAVPVLAGGQQIVEGHVYPNTVEVEGSSLRLVGAGLRGVRRFFIPFDVYTMGAYSANSTCDASALISADEIKSIRINTLRDLSADTIRSGLANALEDNTPGNASESLRGQIQTFLTYFEQDLFEHASMELTYIPGAGTTVRQNGEEQGAVTPGKAFADILWSSYFSDDSCCEDLKNAILTSCSDLEN